jgi:hypothetical protein
MIKANELQLKTEEHAWRVALHAEQTLQRIIAVFVPVSRR